MIDFAQAIALYWIAANGEEAIMKRINELVLPGYEDRSGLVLGRWLGRDKNNLYNSKNEADDNKLLDKKNDNDDERCGDDTKESGIMVNTENLGGRSIISKLMDGNIATCR